jgi:TonB family protein
VLSGVKAMAKSRVITLLGALCLAGCQTAPSPPPTPVATGPLVDGPIDPKGAHWAHIPTGNQMASVYPDTAAHREISGESRVRCRVLADGKLGGCVVLSEAPADMGFGAAGLQSAAFFQLAPANYGPNATIVVPIHWRLH